jgi:peptidyl-tRNA hydrolase
MDDPYRMYLVVRRGAFEDLETGGVLAGAAAVACVRRFAQDPERAEAVQAWRERPGKVTLRARGGQWDEVLRSEDFAHAGDLDGAAVLALPPMRRSERSELIARKLQAFASELAPPPAVEAAPEPDRDGRITYIINPSLEMSTGKTIAQVAHAATMSAATGRVEGWVARGCPGRVVVPVSRRLFDALCTDAGRLSAKVEDAGLTEVPPGTITVLAVAPAATP